MKGWSTENGWPWKPYPSGTPCRTRGVHRIVPEGYVSHALTEEETKTGIRTGRNTRNVSPADKTVFLRRGQNVFIGKQGAHTPTHRNVFTERQNIPIREGVKGQKNVQSVAFYYKIRKNAKKGAFLFHFIWWQGTKQVTLHQQNELLPITLYTKQKERATL